TLAFVSELVADQLSVDAIHRLYSRITPAQLAAALGRRFDLEPAERPTPQSLGAMAAEGFVLLVGRDRAWKLTPKPGAFDGVRALDGAWLEAALEGTAATVGYQHGLAETLAEVDAGRAAAAV